VNWKVVAVLPFFGGWNIGSCWGGGAPPPTTVTDSAGVEIVLGAPGKLPGVRVKEELRIGVAEGDGPYALNGVRSVATTSDGTLVVADGGSATVRVYTADGEFIRQFGGKGVGSGATDMLQSAGVAGDTVFVVASSAGRPVTILFDLGGGFLTSWPRNRGDAGTVSLLGRSDRHWVGTVLRFPDPSTLRPGDRMTYSLGVHAVDPRDGTIGERLAVRPGRSLTFRGGMDLESPPIFDPVPRIQAAVDGRIFYTAGDGYDIEVLDDAGVLVRRIRRDVERAGVTPDLFESFRTSVEAFFEEIPPYPGKTEEMRRVTQGREPVVPYLPVIGGMITGSDGSLWVERGDLAEDPVAREVTLSVGEMMDDPDPRTWEVFDRTGAAVATVRLPAAFEPHVADHESVTGVLRDDRHTEYVVRFRLRW